MGQGREREWAGCGAGQRRVWGRAERGHGAGCGTRQGGVEDKFWDWAGRGRGQAVEGAWGRLWGDSRQPVPPLTSSLIPHSPPLRSSLIPRGLPSTASLIPCALPFMWSRIPQGQPLTLSLGLSRLTYSEARQGKRLPSASLRAGADEARLASAPECHKQSGESS